MNHKINFPGIAPNIEKTLYDYVGIGSFSDTVHEREVEPFLMDLMGSFHYFKENPNHFGKYEIPDDHLGRSVFYGMVMGQGSDTICLVHHYDVVGVEDYKTLKDYALKPELLHEMLEKNPGMLSPEAQDDLDSGEFLFCKGGCDMKAGGSIQFTLLKEYGNLVLEGNPPNGNIIVIAVPDEENLSAGMRGAVLLLAELKEKYNLNYKLMINSEPHQRKDPKVGVFSLGSVGKIMPFVYVRGSLSHVGKVFEGLNPLNILSEIQRRTELNMDFSDRVETGEDTAECSPPPTWIYSKDSKEVYDVSMPLNGYGCVSILSLTSSPGEILARLRKICEESFDKIIKEMNESYRDFLVKSKREPKELPWKVKVSDFDELLREAIKDYGPDFTKLYQDKKRELLSEFNQAKRSIIKCNYELVNFVYDYVKDVSPRVVYGLVPPYYPCVSNLEYEKEDIKIAGLYPLLKEYASSNYNQDYVKEYFFSGISDLSYTDMHNPQEIRKALSSSMALFGDFYNIPLEEISQISMPCINIGPWGKDFHKLSERVLTEDVYERTPRLIDAAIKYMLD